MATLRVKIQNLHKANKCPDFVPSEWVGADAQGNYHGIMWLRTTKESGVMARSGIQAQCFPINKRQILSELLVFQLYDELESTMRGDSTALPISEIDAAVRTCEESFEPRGFAGMEGSRSVET